MFANLGIGDLISIEPSKGPDGQTRYLSTPEVIDDGIHRLVARSIEVGLAGVITFDAPAAATARSSWPRCEGSLRSTTS